MKTASYQALLRERLETMTPEKRAAHDEAVANATLALRMAELFYEARTGAGLTQTELAARMGTTQPTIARIEGGGRVPTVEMLERLAAAVGQRLKVALVS